MGEVFAGRYELLDLIGQGGMGSVWRVHDRRTDEVLAAKVLRQSDAASLLRFVRETAFRVQHPHVVTPLGWVGEDDRVLFTMPVVDGGSVATLVGDHGPLPPRFVAEILRQLLDGLATVHASGIVHRDIKPANLLLRGTGAGRPHIYLTDFGIAAELGGPRLTETDVAIGTRGYMAPEQLRGEVRTASDLYAVGAVALVMLTAQRPEPGGAVPARPEGAPEELWDLLEDLLAEDPDARPDAGAARGRLAAPELAWTPGAAGDVEVLRQVGEDLRATDAGPAEVPPPPEDTPPEPPTVPRGRGVSSAGPARATLPGSWRAWWAVGVGAALVLALLAALITWRTWSVPDGDSDTVSSSSSAPDDPTGTPSTGSTEETTSPTPTETSSSGSYEVGIVVTRVGQECSFSDVGLEEETTDGVPVRCERGGDGAYSWERQES